MHILGLYNNPTKERIIKTIKAFFITLLLYIIILALIVWLLHKVKIEDSASASEQSIILNLQDFQPSSSSQSEEEIPQESEEPTEEVQSETQTEIPQEKQSQSNHEEIGNPLQAPDLSAPISDNNKKELSKETLKALTKKLFEKIAKSADVPNKSNKKKITEKKVTPSEAQLENLLAQKTEKPIQKKRLSKTVSQKEKLAKEKRLDAQLKKETFLKAQKKKQEMISKKRSFLKEQERLAKEKEKAKKKEREKKEKEAEKIARAEAYLAQQEQIRKIAELTAQKATRIAKAKQEQKTSIWKTQERGKKGKKTQKHNAIKKKHQRAVSKNKIKKAKRKGKKSKKNKSKKNLLNALSKHNKKSPPQGYVSQSTLSMIKRFYGAEFNGFTGTQKAFIEQNLGNIYVITQHVLSRRGYPNVAKHARQEGTQLVTFYLHPNGRISRLRLKRRLGYTSLDKNTLQVVRIAHANYPRPKTTTKITFYVEYSLD